MAMTLSSAMLVVSQSQFHHHFLPSSPSFELTESTPIRTSNFLLSFPSSNPVLKWRIPRPLRSSYLKLYSSSGKQTVEVASPIVEPADEVVRKFYGGINGRDLPSVADLISDNCVYEDLIFSRPFVGRKDILDFFESFTNLIDKDLQFVIDKITTQDSSAVGVTWHLEWKGKPFPFSRGCSFYQLEVINGKRLITYGRDSVEPAIKPGKAALVIIRGVTWLLQQFPQLADRL
ncbi:uncharacterized protein LOC115705027 [Cannabis sativa]|uniref:Nuclear transport factor 2 domain-containing protein n=2 Tax=Cannabis sativa TaxID=3483 RepID=A0AB40EBS5_CANSA|nr:uncharacterized protein LOC115705027 [Cannabis sativa]KAF4346535.1 hypothetical protein G4B88_016263 [Cannabis sativa]KAF4348749.1 hypothetical protein F8388_015579 [Cannabis sativa]